jgi:hypothetical protein
VESGDIDKEGRKQRKKRLKRNLVDMPTSHGEYKKLEDSGAFGMLNNMTTSQFNSESDLAKEIQGTEADFAPEASAPGPAPTDPADAGAKGKGKVKGLTGKGHVSDMFVLEQELSAARHKVTQLKQQYVRHKNDIQSAPVFRASLATAQVILEDHNRHLLTL